MKKLKAKKIVLLVIAVITIVSATAISCGALDFHCDNYDYKLEDGWQDSAILEYNTAKGILSCRYTDGAFTAPKTETSVVRGSTRVIQCSVYSQITLKNGKYETGEATGEYNASLELKAGTMFSKVNSTIQYGFANDGTYVAEGQFNGSK